MLDQVECIIASNRFGHYCMPKSSIHRPAPQKILEGEVYEPQTIEFMIRNCDHRDIVAAGAYFGDFLPALSRHIAPNAMVWTFEPNRENFMCASWTMRLNGISNVQLNHYALGEAAKDAMVSLTDGEGRSPGGNSIIRDLATAAAHKNTTWQPIQVITLDDYLDPRRPIGIIQFDLEAYERLALMGAIRTIERHRPLIILETVPPNWVTEHLLPLGYREICKLHGNTTFAMEGAKVVMVLPSLERRPG